HGNGNGHGPSLSIEAQRLLPTPDATHGRKTTRTSTLLPGITDWGKYEPAIRRWEALTRPAPAPTVDGKLSPAFVEWMMGYPEGWVDGLTRTQALKALGNAVVPQQALAALSVLEPALAREVAA